MKDTAIDHSIGAALQACARQEHAGQGHAGQGHADHVHAERQAVRPAVPAATARNREASQPVHLTERQFQVLALLCEGLQNKRICRRLNIATGTVKVHISGILRELGASSRLEAVVLARRYGLVREPVGDVAGQVEVTVPGHRPETAGARQAIGRYEDAVAF